MLADKGQDIRGRDVIAKDGEKIGTVDALFVDGDEERVRFMRLKAGGFLGIGEKSWLIPVDAITRVDKDEVHVDQSYDRIVSAPGYDPDVILKSSHTYYDGLYGHYGYAPYWSDNYLYPLWW
jgi:hypothetical protein